MNDLRSERNRASQTEKRQFNLEERTFEFAQEVREFVKKLPSTLGNLEDAKLLVRSSGSVAANYVGANIAATEQESLQRIKMCSQDAKLSRLLLRLLDLGGKDELEEMARTLEQESLDLTSTFSAIYKKVD